MEAEEALYATVAEELRQGNIRQGLWAKALSEEGYDEQKAKARYLRLRVQSLRKEMHDAAISKQDQANAHQKQLKQQAIQQGYAHLEQRTASLLQLQRIRTRIRKFGFWGSFVLAGLLVVFYPRDEATNPIAILMIAAAIGLFSGVLGFVVAEITRWFMPSQQELHREETSIKEARANLDYAQMSWLGKLGVNTWNIVISLIVIIYLIFIFVKNFST